jgi:hypothetical protein
LARHLNRNPERMWSVKPHARRLACGFGIISLKYYKTRQDNSKSMTEYCR